MTSECAAILVLFVTRVIGFSDTDASVLFHGFTVVAYLTPILGAILADSFIGNYRAVFSTFIVTEYRSSKDILAALYFSGKFQTIFYVSILYAIGQVVIVLGKMLRER